MHKYLNQIINQDCLKAIPLLDDESVDGSVIDPPYGQGFDYAGDSSIYEAEELLFNYLKVLEPKLKRNSYIAIFWTMLDLDVCIDVLRSAGFTYRRTLSLYLPKGGARPFLGWLPRTQAIVIGQKYLPKKPSDFHTDLATYLNEALEKSSFNRSSLAKELGCDSRLVMKWTRVEDPSWCLPTPRFYKRLKVLLNLDGSFDIMLNRQPSHEANSREFIYKHDTYIVDNKNNEMLHPAQKPLSVVEHLVQSLIPDGGTVIDGFAGSGTTALAAINTGRKFICYEISEDYYKISVDRIGIKV